MNERELCAKAIEAFGRFSQILVLFEELSELQQAVCKHLRGQDAANIAEEIADVEIVLNQAKIMFNVEEAVEKQKSYKLQRLEKMIKMCSWMREEAE